MPRQQEANSSECPVDLRTSNMVTASRQEEHARSPPPLYCCDVGLSSSQRNSTTTYYHHHHHHVEEQQQQLEPFSRSCQLSCCVDPIASGPSSIVTCYQDYPLPKSTYSESQSSVYSSNYSPRESIGEASSFYDAGMVESSSPLKRSHCTLACCSDVLPPTKRFFADVAESSSREVIVPPQERPLDLVKPKVNEPPVQSEPVSSTVPTPPAPQASSKRDAILFKPYLDNPISKPSRQESSRVKLSPNTSQNLINNNNNNCQSICNLNDVKGHDYALELSLRLPLTWGHHNAYPEFSQVRHAFVRYPASPHYT